MGGLLAAVQELSRRGDAATGRAAGAQKALQKKKMKRVYE